jgi:IclR helix-turn-helix domain
MAEPIPPPGDLDREPSLVKSAERTVRILETLAASPSRLTLSELQRRVGYPRSSLPALMRTLTELKWIEADASRVAYGIGPHALLTGTAYLDKDPVLPHTQQTLEDLRAEIGHTVHFARRDDSHVLYLASRDSRNAVHTIPRVGRRLPMHLVALGPAAYECEQGTPGVACAADYRIPATDAISCSMPAAVPPAEVERIAAAVVRHTHALANTLRREGIR